MTRSKPVKRLTAGHLFIFVRKENKLNSLLPGNQILKSLELLAKVELVGDNVTNNPPTVKKMSNCPPQAVDTVKK